MQLNRLYQMEIVREIDLAFAKMIRRLDPEAEPSVAIAAALVSRAATRGDVCLDLAQLEHSGIQRPDASAPIRLDLTLEQWRKTLCASRSIGRPGEITPMILDGNRLYLQRYWKYEQQVAQAIIARCDATTHDPKSASSRDNSHMGFPRGDAEQQRAVRTAIHRRFTVISGGPGTGKTYTIAKIISLLQTESGGDLPRIKLAAPTGKAAARLQEALDDALSNISKTAEKSGPPPKARTLHRLLGAVAGKSRYRYDARNPLPADVVIVDEASMVDLAMMAKLMQAVPPAARLILVGDKDQLASVEAGAVLGDICSGLMDPDEQGNHHAAGDSTGRAKKERGEGKPSPIVVLKKNYRFGDRSGIHRLGLAVNHGDGDGALTLLENGDQRRLAYLSMDKGFDLGEALAGMVEAAFGPIFAAQNPIEALGHLMGFKILTPLRKGPFGVEGLNMAVQRILRQKGVIPTFQAASPWYAGRPVMITRNDYYHNLYNGDIGITTMETVAGARRIRVAFPDDLQGVTYLSPEQLPEHETVYAMTVHKSQGTEFDNVLLVLPDKDVPILTRELIYTAITRAREKVTIWSRGQIFKTAVQRRIKRASGLRNALQR